jgi:hypothetical protein
MAVLRFRRKRTCAVRSTGNQRRLVVSVLLRALGDFSLHPQGGACGRPPAAAVLGPAKRIKRPNPSPYRRGLT